VGDVKPRTRLLLITLFAVISILLVAYISSYFYISRKRAAEWRALRAPGFLYVSPEEPPREIVSCESRAAKRNHRLYLFYYPIHELDEALGGPPLIACLMTDIGEPKPRLTMNPEWDERRLRSEFVGKAAKEVLNHFRIPYSDLEFIDEPPAKLRAVRWVRAGKGKNEDVTVHLNYTKELFSQSRTWDEGVVKRAIVTDIDIRDHR
jgi:hypothetical protein